MAATADDVGEVCVVMVWLFVVAHITKLGVVIPMFVAHKYSAYSSPLCEEPLDRMHKHTVPECITPVHTAEGDPACRNEIISSATQNISDLLFDLLIYH